MATPRQFRKLNPVGASNATSPEQVKQALEEVVRVINTMQSNIENSVGSVIRAELLNGRLIENVNLTAAVATSIEHKLDRNYRGWYIVKQNTNANVWQIATESEAKFLQLQTSASCMVSIWVF